MVMMVKETRRDGGSDGGGNGWQVEVDGGKRLRCGGSGGDGTSYRS